MNAKSTTTRDALSPLHVLLASVVLLLAIPSYFFIHSDLALFRSVNLLVSVTHVYFVYLAACRATTPNVAVSLLFFALSVVLKFPVEIT